MMWLSPQVGTPHGSVFSSRAVGTFALKEHATEMEGRQPSRRSQELAQMRWANQDEAARAAAARLREARDTAVSSAFAAVGPGGGETFGHAWRDAVVDLEHVEQLRQYARYAPVDRRRFSALGTRAA